MERVVLRIFTDAQMELSIEGVSGPACSEKLRPIKDNLGIVIETQETAEMHEATQTQEVEQ